MELIDKIMAENQRRMAIEAEVAQMEEEELQLIQKLQNTQLLQKAGKLPTANTTSLRGPRARHCWRGGRGERKPRQTTSD